jgi:hypothetical protein
MACIYNRPTSLAVMGLDRIEYANTGVTEMEGLTLQARKFLDELEMVTAVPIEFAGSGFGTFDAVIRTLRAELSHV